MGLDMYLTGRKFLWSNERTKINRTVEKVLKPEKGLESIDVNVIELEIMYWRKANHFHNWFVKVCQNGIDDCDKYPVTLDNIKNLVETCKEILSDNSLASELLPTQSGCFFGGTEYDEYYYQSLKEFVEKFDGFENINSLELFYKSSW